MLTYSIGRIHIFEGVNRHTSTSNDCIKGYVCIYVYMYMYKHIEESIYKRLMSGILVEHAYVFT